MRISDWSSDVCSSDLYNGKEDHADNEDEHLFHDLATATNTPALSFADVAAKAALSMFMLRGIEIHEREYAIKAEYAQDKYARSEERRVGKEGGSRCRSGWSPYNKKKKKKKRKTN